VKRFVIPPKRSAAFVAAMETILDTYAAPPDPAAPLICVDEAGTTLQEQVRPLLPMRPGQPACEDTEYARRGSASLFMAYAPHLGWRHVTVADRRGSVEWAQVMRDLVDVHFPDAATLTIVCDNLNTHTLASLYTAFPPAEAARIARKLELRFTPTHGSWLNMAELEWSVLARQCLARRLPDRPTLDREIAAWEAARNAVATPGHWAFTVEDARTHLASLYPLIAQNE
jgi:DDE superfamily endonuclease